MESNMDHQAFDVLEERIDQILSLVSDLKIENEQLKNAHQAMKSSLEEKERTIITLQEEVERFKSMRNEVETYREKQDRIKNKVENLLDKLKEFEDVS